MSAGTTTAEPEITASVATVVRVDSRVLSLEPEEPSSAALLRATCDLVHDDRSPPCTGDRVRFTAADGDAVVVALEARRTALVRGDADGTSRRQVLAANIDVVAVVAALVPAPRPARIERMLALAWASGAEPVVLLTKADLASDAAEAAAPIAEGATCPVVVVSAATGLGLDSVRGLLAGGRVMALLGPSGVGKSSLVNALDGHEVMSVGAVRTDGKGRHTTVTREWHRVAGGAVIDGPGLRAVALAGAEGVEEVYAEIVALADHCRFTDCAHQSEPGCAVLAAVDDGTLSRRRLDGWRRLAAEARWQESRHDARIAAERRREWRTRSRAMRRDGLNRP